mgnify:CR=1 FL=1
MIAESDQAFVLSPNENFGLNAMQSKRSISSTASARGLRAAGRGIAIVSNAGARRAAIMEPRARTLGTLGYANGAARTPAKPRAWTRGGGSNRSTVCRPHMWMRCASARADVAPSVAALRLASSSITVTRRGMSARCSVRHATPFSAGTRRRLTQSCAFSGTWRRTAADQPCHADMLLELAYADSEAPPG